MEAHAAGTDDPPLKVRDIVQIISPRTPLHMCLAVVDEVKSWGALVYITLPSTATVGEYVVMDDKISKRLYIRLARGNLLATGGSAWLEEVAEPQQPEHRKESTP